MKIIEVLFKISKFFPSVNLKMSSNSKNALYEISSEIAPKIDHDKYVGTCIFVSLIFAFLIFLLLFVMSDINLGLILGIGMLVFGCLAFLLLNLPLIELNQRVSEAEIELPQVLRKIGIMIELGTPFQKALLSVAEENSALGKQIKNVLNEIDAGASVSRTLSQWATKVKSNSFKRAIAQLLSCYEHGQSGKEMKAIGDELLAIQQHSFRDAATRSSTVGLLFVATAALLPTFFIILSVIGQPLTSITFSENTFIIVLLTLFPAISLLIIMLAKATLPKVFLCSKKRIDLVPLLLSLFVVGFWLFLQPPYNYAISAIAIAVLGVMLYKKYQKEKQLELLEAALPDALFAIATLPKGSKIERIISTIKNGNYGHLSEEATIALRQLNAGVKPDIVFTDIGKRNNSENTERVFQLLVYAINTNSLNRMTEVAEDLLKFREISRERSAILGIQKYTLLFGGILVPLILKTTLSLVKDMQNFIEPSMQDLLPLAVKIIPGYVIIYSALVSYYLSEIEEKESALPVYFILLVVVGMLILSIM